MGDSGHMRGATEFGIEIGITLILGVLAVAFIYFFILGDPWGLLKGGMNFVASIKDSFTNVFT